MTGKKPGSNHWSKAEDALLMELRQTCRTWKQIGERMPDRTWQACKRRGDKLGLWAPVRPRRYDWTEEQDNQIKQMRAEGYGYDLIGANLGRHKDTVKNRADALGLPKFKAKGGRKKGVKQLRPKKYIPSVLPPVGKQRPCIGKLCQDQPKRNLSKPGLWLCESCTIYASQARMG